MSTLNRNAKSYLLAIAGAEYATGLVPPGTHDWARFRTPAEMTAAMAHAGLIAVPPTGIVFHPQVRAWIRICRRCLMIPGRPTTFEGTRNHVLLSMTWSDAMPRSTLVFTPPSLSLLLVPSSPWFLTPFLTHPQRLLPVTSAGAWGLSDFDTDVNYILHAVRPE